MGAEEDAIFVVNATVGQRNIVCCDLGARCLCGVDGRWESNATDMDVFLVGLWVRVLVACYEESVRLWDEDTGFMSKWTIIVLQKQLELRVVAEDRVCGFVIDLER